VTNTDPNDVIVAAVDEAVPAEFKRLAWTCVASELDARGAPSGTGDIHTTVTLVAGASATFTLTRPQLPGPTVPTQLPNTGTAPDSPAGVLLLLGAMLTLLGFLTRRRR